LSRKSTDVAKFIRSKPIKKKRNRNKATEFHENDVYKQKGVKKITKADLTEVILNSGDFEESQRKMIGRKKKLELQEMVQSLKETQRQLSAQIVDIGHLDSKLSVSLAKKPKKQLKTILQNLIASTHIFVNIEPLLIPNSI
jgi:hypothetical protein